jgi:hypothetical protein
MGDDLDDTQGPYRAGMLFRRKRGRTWQYA